jgi:hypothetical protein
MEEFGRTWMERPWHNLKFQPGICLERTEKNDEIP